MTDYSWMGRAAIPAVIAIVFSLSRKYIKGPELEEPAEEGRRLAGGSFMINVYTFLLLALVAVGGYYLLRSANHLYARLDGRALYRVYAPTSIWALGAGFSALCLASPVTMAVLRKLGFQSDIYEMQKDWLRQCGFDSCKLMRGAAWVFVPPIAFFTLLEIPNHVSLNDQEIRWTHYASFRPEIFRYDQAVRATWIDGYLVRDGSFVAQKDLALDFKDGRRFLASSVWDGGEEPSDTETALLLAKTGLTPDHVRTKEDMRPLAP